MIYRSLQLVCVIAGIAAVVALVSTGILLATIWRVVDDSALASCGNNCSPFMLSFTDAAMKVLTLLILVAACAAGFRLAGMKAKSKH